MSVTVDRAHYVRVMRRSLGAMFLTIVLYAVIVLWFVPVRPMHSAQTPSLVEIIGLVVGNGALLFGLAYWQRTPTRPMMDLPARKHGKAEREPGWPPRARVLRKRLLVVAWLFEVPALLGVVLRTFGLERGEAIAFVAASGLAMGWLVLRLPRKVEETLG